MKQDISNLLQEALKLPVEARAALAGTLFDSLDESIDQDAESAWEAEISQRLNELDENKVKLVPWTEVRSKIIGN